MNAREEYEQLTEEEISSEKPNKRDGSRRKGSTAELQDSENLKAFLQSGGKLDK